MTILLYLAHGLFFWALPAWLIARSGKLSPARARQRIVTATGIAAGAATLFLILDLLAGKRSHLPVVLVTSLSLIVSAASVWWAFVSLYYRKSSRPAAPAPGPLRATQSEKADPLPPKPPLQKQPGGNHARLQAAKAVLDLPRSENAVGVMYELNAFLEVDYGDEASWTIERWNQLMNGSAPLSREFVDEGDVSPAEYLRFGTRRLRIPPLPDQDTTLAQMMSFATILKPDYELRFCPDSIPNSTLCFLALSAAEWANLESQYGADAVMQRFAAIPERLEDFEALFGSPKSMDFLEFLIHFSFTDGGNSRTLLTSVTAETESEAVELAKMELMSAFPAAASIRHTARHAPS